MQGAGTAITFQSGLFGSIRDANFSGMTRAPIRTSHFGTTGGHTYEPAKNFEPGQWTVQVLFDGSVSLDAIMGAAAETVTITDSDGTPNVRTFSGFCVDVGVVYPWEDKVLATFTLQVSGGTTVS